MSTDRANNLLEKAYKEINDNIKFAEAKNGALITLNSAIIALGSGFVFAQGVNLCYRWLFATFAVSLLFPLVLSILSFRAAIGTERRIVKWINEKVKNESNKVENIGTPKLLYFAYIYSQTPTPREYLEAIGGIPSDIPDTSIEYQLASQVVDLSAVAFRKFVLFNVAIKVELLIFVVAMLVAVITLVARLLGG